MSVAVAGRSILLQPLRDAGEQDQSATGSVVLERGVYQMVVRYAHTAGPVAVDLKCAYGGEPLRALPSTILLPTSQPPWQYGLRSVLVVLAWATAATWLLALIAWLVARTHRPSIWFVVGTTAAVAFGIWTGVPPWLRGPAPYPPEWRWGYRCCSYDGLWPAAAAAVSLIVLLSWVISQSVPRRPRDFVRRTLPIIIALGLSWQLALLHSQPNGAIATLAHWFGARGSSFFTVAKSTADIPVGEILATYRDRLPRMPLHAATHPPGTVLYYRAIIAATTSYPGLTESFLFVTRHLGVSALKFRPPDDTHLTSRK
jgi:hypothetical protein